jgi:hypothetical protein
MEVCGASGRRTMNYLSMRTHLAIRLKALVI